MVEQETATLPAEDASLKELVDFDSARRDELSETQQARITEYNDLSGVATATAVADTTTRLTTEHADATAEERRVAEVDAKAADDKTYYEKWRPLEIAATEDERADYIAEMANADNHARYQRGGTVAREPVAAEITVEDVKRIRDLTQQETYNGWTTQLEAAGLPNVVPALSDSAGWQKIIDSDKNLPQHVHDVGFEAGVAAEKQRALDEVAAGGPENVGGGSPSDGGKQKPSTAGLSYSEMIEEGMGTTRKELGSAKVLPKASGARAS